MVTPVANSGSATTRIPSPRLVAVDALHSTQNRRCGASASTIPALPRFPRRFPGRFPRRGRGGHGVDPAAGDRDARPVQVSTSP